MIYREPRQAALQLFNCSLDILCHQLGEENKQENRLRKETLKAIEDKLFIFIACTIICRRERSYTLVAFMSGAENCSRNEQTEWSFIQVSIGDCRER